MAAASRSANASGVQAKAGTPTLARAAACSWSNAGAPSSDNASSTTQVTPCWASRAMRATSASRTPPSYRSESRIEDRVRRAGHERLAVGHRAVDVGAAAELHAEQQVDRIVEHGGQIDDARVEGDDRRAQ